MADLMLALRNLLRNRRRSASTLIALAIGLTAVLLFSGFKANLGATMLTAVVRAGGHLQIQHRDYYLFGGGNPGAYGIPNYQELVRAVQKDPQIGALVAVATPMMRFGGLAGNFDVGITRTILGSGFVAEDITRMRQWNEHGVPVVKPRFPLEGSPQDSAVVGIGVARVLQLCKSLAITDCPTPAVSSTSDAGSGGNMPHKSGKAARSMQKVLPSDIASLAEDEVPKAAKRAAGTRIELLSASARGAPNVAALNVLAAEDQVFKELDEVAVLVHLSQAQRLVFGTGQGQATAIMVMLHRSSDLARVQARIQEIVASLPQGGDLAVRSFTELNPFYTQSEKLFDFIFGFIFVLIGGIVLFTVGNTMNTAVVERTTEIGTLRAIGLRQSGVRRLFLLEGFLIGLAGAVAGLLLAVLAGAAVNHSGLSWLPPGTSESMPFRLRVLGDAAVVSGSLIGLVAIATASAWLPAWRAAQLKIVEALRHA